jgi:hypothetical protein
MTRCVPNGALNGLAAQQCNVLLENMARCGSGGFQVLASDGSIRPLTLPKSIAASPLILNVDGDLATVLVASDPGCDLRRARSGSSTTTW